MKKIPCKVCGQPSSGVHFGVITCQGCKVKENFNWSFFSRIYLLIKSNPSQIIKGFYRRFGKEKMTSTVCTNANASVGCDSCRACRSEMRSSRHEQACKIGRQSNLFKVRLKSQMDIDPSIGAPDGTLHPLWLSSSLSNEYTNAKLEACMANGGLPERQRNMVHTVEIAYGQLNFKLCFSKDLNIDVHPSLIVFQFMLTHSRNCQNFLNNLPCIQTHFRSFCFSYQTKCWICHKSWTKRKFSKFSILFYGTDFSKYRDLWFKFQLLRSPHVRKNCDRAEFVASLTWHK